MKTEKNLFERGMEVLLTSVNKAQEMHDAQIKKEVKMSKEFKDQGYYKKEDGLYYKSITSLATDKEIQDLWEIISNILDRNNIDDSGELSIKLI